MATAAPSNYLPIIYGSAAVGYKPDHSENAGNSTHRWTFYVRASETGRDLQLVVQRVVFRLHPTCTHPVVECLVPPYETSQLGWGELRLHATGVPTSKPIISEQYDEVVFHPQQAAGFISNQLAEYHKSIGVIPLGDHATFAPYWKQFSEENDLMQIARAHAYVKQELELALLEYEQVEREYLQRASAVPTHPPAPPVPSPPPAIHTYLDDAPPKVYAISPPPLTLQQQQLQLQQQQQQQRQMQAKKDSGVNGSASSTSSTGNGQPSKKKGRPTLQDNKTKPVTKKSAATAATTTGSGTMPTGVPVVQSKPKLATQPKPKPQVLPKPNLTPVTTTQSSPPPPPL
ncbi:hypothetical protein BASA81_005865 [Batrachochytrium salamandrivorans]|nr:hypothetical protein BASA81_005865 [Batrachochytrium salamandrivorans]